MAARRLQPYRQGRLDGLCGVYALINALRLLSNGNIAEYLVPVNADVGQFEVVFVDEHDPHVNPLGVEGVGEIALVGVAAAIANAVHHATGQRVRDLPITPEKLL